VEWSDHDSTPTPVAVLSRSHVRSFRTRPDWLCVDYIAIDSALPFQFDTIFRQRKGVAFANDVIFCRDVDSGAGGPEHQWRRK